MDMSASKIAAIAFGILQGSLAAIVVVGCILIGGNAPSLQVIIIVVGICIVGGVALCVALAPARIAWNSKELTIKRAWGIETTYSWNELVGISSYGVTFGICFLQFTGHRIIYIGSYGFAAGDWKGFQKWLRQRFDDRVSPVPRL
ncbi:MAG: hypothetical protein IAE97_00100 [Chthoniobacterales bacterium]|nr:hypothetical protein [Chthoniobacterales bacterium]